jgi:VCBS repeat-containing protein
VLRSRIAAAATVAVVVLGFGLAAPAFADGSTTTSTTSTTSTTEAPPVVTNAGGSFTVSLPGVGSLTFTVDPATGAVSNVVATADPTGTFTAGTPTTTDEGVQVTFTGKDGTVKVLQAHVDAETGEPVTVTAKAKTKKPCPTTTSSTSTTTPATGTTPTTAEADESNDCDPPEATEPPETPEAQKPAESEKSNVATPEKESDHAPSSSDTSHHSTDGGSGD